MNLGQIQAAVQSKGYTTDTAAQQLIEINGCYREICGMKRWMFLEAQDTSLNTVIGENAYPVPMPNWRSLDAIRLQILGSQEYDNLKFMDPQDFREYEHIDRDTTTPYYWTLYSSLIHFYPYPDNVYNAVIDYIIQPPDLALSTDTPIIPSVYHDILVWGCIEGMAFRERDWLGRQFAQTKKDDLVAKMDDEFTIRQRQTSSHVVKSGFWETQLPFPFVNEGF